MSAAHVDLIYVNRSQYSALLYAVTDKTSSSAIAERLRCRVGQIRPKVTDDILQTLRVYLQPLT